MMRARGEVFEPGKEEPGGVGDGEVIGREEGAELQEEVAKHTPEGFNFFPRRFASAPIFALFLQNFTFTFFYESRTLLVLFSKRKHVTRA